MVVELGMNSEKRIFLNMGSSQNRHILITGISGSGKSCAGQKLLRNVVASGGTVVVFDMHRLFAEENILPALKEDIAILSNEIDAYHDGIRLPLFTPLELASGQPEDLEDLELALTAVLAKAFRLGCRQEADLREAIEIVAEKKIYEKEGISAVSKVLSLIESSSISRVEDKLRPILKRNVFQDGESIKSGSINLLRLSSFDVDTQKAVTEVILAFLWRKAQAGQFTETPLWLYLDEVQNLDLTKRGTVGQILSEGRKLGLNLIVITQEAESHQFKGFAQAATQLIFRPAMQDGVRIAKRLSGCRWQREATALRMLEVGECLAIGRLCNERGEAVQSPLKIAF